MILTPLEKFGRDALVVVRSVVCRVVGEDGHAQAGRLYETDVLPDVGREEQVAEEAANLGSHLAGDEDIFVIPKGLYPHIQYAYSY